MSAFILYSSVNLRDFSLAVKFILVLQVVKRNPHKDGPRLDPNFSLRTSKMATTSCYFCALHSRGKYKPLRWTTACSSGQTLVHLTYILKRPSALEAAPPPGAAAWVYSPDGWPILLIPLPNSGLSDPFAQWNPCYLSSTIIIAKMSRLISRKVTFT